MPGILVRGHLSLDTYQPPHEHQSSPCISRVRSGNVVLVSTHAAWQAENELFCTYGGRDAALS
jgi:hypothetical protein